MKKHFTFLIVLFIAISCASNHSSKDAIKVRPFMKAALIKWGECKNVSDSVDGYVLNSEGEVNHYYGYGKNIGEKIADNRVDKFIYAYEKLVYLTRKVQTLQAPGERSRFIEFEDKKQNFYFRAVWNPEYKLPINEEFRKLYDSLQIIVTKLEKP